MMNVENWQDPTKLAFTCIILLKKKTEKNAQKSMGCNKLEYEK